MQSITLSFPYMDALGQFLELIVLASVLSLVCTSLTEVIKNLFCKMFIKTSPRLVVAINGIVCMLTAIAWARTFAQNEISPQHSVWLGIILWLGSQGLFVTLEDSNGWLGKYFRSLSSIIEEEDIQILNPPEEQEIDRLREQITKLTDELEKLKEEAKPETAPPKPEDTIPTNDLFRYPVDYIAVTGEFSPPDHYAVDFGWSSNYAGANQEIFSAFPGIVDMASFYTGGAGNMVRVYFDDEENNCRWYGIYKHLSEINVSRGDNVKQGDSLGLMGNTGDATGNHLHFDLVKVPYGSGYTQTQASRAKYSVDPLLYLYVYPNQVVGDDTDSRYDILRVVES